MIWILIFLSLAFGALLGALFWFPIFTIVIPLILFFIFKNHPREIFYLFLIILSGILMSNPRVESGEYEIIGFVERESANSSVLKNVRILNGDRWVRYNKRIIILERIPAGYYIYSFGCIKGNLFFPGYVKVIREVKNLTTISWEMRIGFGDLVRRNVGNESLILSVLFGERRRKEIEESGLSYLFAVSGLHVGLSYIFFNTLISFITWRRILKSSLSLIFTGIYVLSIATPSAFRAFIMIFLWEIFHMMGKKRHPLEIMGITGTFMLFSDPSQILSPSFLMSFGATSMILLALSRTKNVFIISLYAYLGALPFLALFFQKIHPLSFLIGIPASFLIIPMFWTSIASFFLYSVSLKTLSSLLIKGMLPFEKLLGWILKISSSTLKLNVSFLFYIIFVCLLFLIFFLHSEQTP